MDRAGDVGGNETMIRIRGGKTRAAIAALAVLMAGASLFCQSSGKDKFVKVLFPNGKSVTAELASTDEERTRGLMFREKILSDQGMLFVFPTENLYSFWMKNTLIPLDILWLDASKRIIHVERSVPPCRRDPCPSYGPNIPALYVLELQSGAADAYGLDLADRLDFILPSWIGK